MEPKPGLTVQTMVVTGLAIALVTWGAIIMWPQVRNDIAPWWRDPLRVSVAIGWMDHLPEVPGSSACEAPGADGAGRLEARASPSGRVYEAVGRGEVTLRCTGSPLTVQIQRVAKLSVAAPATLRKGDAAKVRLMAYDLKGEPLRLGSLSRVAWRVEGPLRFEHATPAGEIVTVIADGPGEGTIEATFDTLVGRMKVRAE